METPPRPDQEAPVLATIMRCPDSAQVAVQWLGSLWKDAFVSSQENTQIAAAIKALIDTGKLPDFRAVHLHLETTGKTSAMAALPHLLKYSEDSAFLEQRCLELCNTTQLRNYVQIASDIHAEVTRGVTDIVAFSDGVQKRLLETTSGALAIKSGAMATAANWERYTKKRSNPGTITGVPCGLATIDAETMGFQFGTMSVLAARPRHGKSAIAGNFAINALRLGYPVFIVGHEMSAEEYTDRMACSIAGVDFQSVRGGKLNTKTQARYLEALNWLGKVPLAIIDEPDASPRQCAAAVANWTNRMGQGLVIIDYLQIERLPNCNKPQHEELGDITWIWRCAFKRTQTAGLLLSQLKRDAETRAPRLSDLKGSGSIEQDASIVMLLYREHLENPKKPANEAWVHMCKHRDGNLAAAKLHFTGFSMTFREWDDDNDKDLDSAAMRAAEDSVTSSQI